jgi:hypothetical protein
MLNNEVFTLGANNLTPRRLWLEVILDPDPRGQTVFK